ncbi:MgtC/SapB family protein [Uliginosibacterium sp. H1]|uniref:MgtC/SapB family protein n=1 Tax=Uliginosibacterium sp. H1 TaxID=3114757 RepID=UPI002E17C52A|nr:MgtC/SapB family protein [Uliginosibacterium sp. H1]
MNEADLWQQIVETVRSEFSDLDDIRELTRVTVRLCVALVLGGLIGLDRERHDSDAGLRTHMLVALGAAMFVVAPAMAGVAPGDMSRVLQGIITGIGFLGGGAIIKLSEQEKIKGLTTAASIWLTAAVGIAAGLGREVTAILATVLGLIVLSLLPHLEKHIPRRDHEDKSTGTRKAADVDQG